MSSLSYSSWNIGVPVLRRNFVIRNCRLEAIQQVDRKTRKTLTVGEIHHPKAKIDFLFVKRNKGRRDLLRFEATQQSTDNQYCRISE